MHLKQAANTMLADNSLYLAISAHIHSNVNRMYNCTYVVLW